MFKLFIMRLKLYKLYKEDNAYRDTHNGARNDLLTNKIIGLERDLQFEEKLKFYDQHSCCWCKCGNELISSRSKSTVDDGGYIDVICDKCNRKSKWDFAAPAPFLLEMEE